MSLTSQLIAHMSSRLTRPLPEGWTVAYPYRPLVTECDICGTRAVFVRVNATDCDVWGMRGIDGADSTAYGTYCHLHA